MICSLMHVWATLVAAGICLSGSDPDPGVAVDVSAVVVYQSTMTADPQVHLHDELGSRRKYEPSTASYWQLRDASLTDTPPAHGAASIRLHLRREWDTDLRFSASFTADHYGISMGTYNRDWVAFYPRYRFDFRRGIDWGLGTVHLDLRAGTFEDFRYYEGLSLYNLDCQGFYGHAQIGHLRYAHLQIGDLTAGIGLGIDDLVDHQLSLEGLRLPGPWRADVAVGFSNYNNAWEDRILDVAHLSLGVTSGENLRIYGQAGYRFTDEDYDARLRLAALLGLRRRHPGVRWEWDARFELRHYGGIHNYHLNNETQVHYRDAYAYQRANFMGSQLYPLTLYERPFGQWAVFTEYHRQYVRGASAQGSVRHRVSGPFWLFLNLDLNAIDPSNGSSFGLWLYGLGCECRLSTDLRASFSITNKAMNLDKHYPTVYMVEAPTLLFVVRRDLAW